MISGHWEEPGDGNDENVSPPCPPQMAFAQLRYPAVAQNRPPVITDSGVRHGRRDYFLRARSAATQDRVPILVTGPKLDRLARSVPDARAIGDDLAGRGIKLSLGGQVYDPTDPMGKMFFNILATFAEFEVDLLRMRTREGMAVARAKGRLRGRQPKLSPKQQAELRRMHATGDYSITDLADLFTVSRPTVYRTLQRIRTRSQ
ncbi:MAG: recombinase family protein [Pseudonocardiaceae bacterium]